MTKHYDLQRFICLWFFIDITLISDLKQIKNLTMRIIKVLFKIIISLLLLFILLSFNSCEVLEYVFQCETCIAYNNNGKLMETTGCGDHEIEQLESEGWDCN
jgi:hypothetical protein